MDSKDSPNQTLHQRLLGDIERKILSGEWPPGYRIPFELDLAAAYNVSRMTMNKVMIALVRAGLIERRKRSGSFVRQPQVQSAILEIADIEAEVRSLRLAYHYRLVNASVGAPGVDEFFDWDIPAPRECRRLLSMHFAGDRPFCLEERLINLAVVPAAREADFSKVAPSPWLLKHLPWSSAEHRILAITAPPSIARLLDIPRHSACLVVERQTWNEAGPVTKVRLTYPAERHSIVARFQPSGS